MSSTAAGLRGEGFLLFSSSLLALLLLFSSLRLTASSLVFLQDVPAQDQNDNPFPPTPPPLRTAALTLALEAPRARRPVAWHEVAAPSPFKVMYIDSLVLYFLYL